MAGFRAAGWTCFAAGAVSVIIGVIGLRGTGIVGSAPAVGATAASSAIELNDTGVEKVAEASVQGSIA